MHNTEEHHPEVLTAIWDAVTVLAEFDKATPMLDKLYIREVGSSWKVVVNGHHKPVWYNNSLEIYPYHVAIFHDGMLYMLASPQEGHVMMALKVVEDFVQAVNEAIYEKRMD